MVTGRVAAGAGKAALSQVALSQVAGPRDTGPRDAGVPATARTSHDDPPAWARAGRLQTFTARAGSRQTGDQRTQSPAVPAPRTSTSSQLSGEVDTRGQAHGTDRASALPPSRAPPQRVS